MQLSLKLSLIIIPSTTVLILLIYYFQIQINGFLNWDNAQNPLLVIVILVDAIGGVLVPFLFIGKNSKLNNTIKLEVNQDST
jgi:hypothetical protein